MEVYLVVVALVFGFMDKKIGLPKDGAVVGAIVEYEDQISALKKAGITYLFNDHSEAGAGFSEHVCSLVNEQGIKVYT